MGSFVKKNNDDETKKSTSGSFVRIGESKNRKGFSTAPKVDAPATTPISASQSRLSASESLWDRGSAFSGIDIDAKLTELAELRRQAAVDLDTTRVDELDKRMKSLRAQAGQQTVGDRVSDTLSAIVSGAAAQGTNVVGFASNAVNNPEYHQRSIARLEETLKSGRTTDGKVLTDAMRETIKSSIADHKKRVEELEKEDSFTNRTYKAADQMADDSAKYQSKAKQGLGAVGSTLVDAGVAFGQSALAGTVGAVTGTGMLPFAVTAFGGATQDARRNGATLDEQFTYGTAQAAKEFVTEKLFGLAVPQKIAGSVGSFDGLIEKGIRNVTERLAKTPGGQQALGGLMTWLAGGVTEGLEEGIGALVEETIINPHLRGFVEDERTTQEKFEEGLYNVLVGGVSGLLGVTNLLSYNPNAVNTEAVKPRNYTVTRDVKVGKDTNVPINPETKEPTPVSPAAAPEVKQAEAQAQVTKAQNPEAEVLDAATTLFTQQGMNLKTAQKRAEIVGKLIAGEEVSDKDLNRIEPTSKQTKAIFTQLTGVQFPAEATSIEKLRDLYRSAHTVAQAAEAQQRAAVAENARVESQITDEQILERAKEARAKTTPESDKKAAQMLAQARGEIAPDGTALLSYKDFSARHKQVFPDASPQETARMYDLYLKDNQTISFMGRRMTRQQVLNTLNTAPGVERLTAEERAQVEADLNEKFDRELEAQKKDGKDATEHSERRRRTEVREKVQRSVNDWKKVLTENSSVKDIVLDESMAENENAYITPDGVVHLNANRMTSEADVAYVLGHELVHSVKDDAARKALVGDIIETVRKITEPSETREAAIERYRKMYQDHENQVAARASREAKTISFEYAEEEYAADLMREVFLSGDMLNKLAAEKPSLMARIQEILQKWIASLKGNNEAVELYNELTALQDRFVQALRSDAAQQKLALENAGIQVDTETESARHDRYSLDTWLDSDYMTDPENAAKALAKAIGVSDKKAAKYIKDVNGVAKLIADNKTLLDYEAAPGVSSFVKNTEYGGSVDFSTICKKRRLFTGTFTAIQKALPNTALTSDEMIDIRKRMKDAGHEVSCGLCYVEGSRLNLGQYATEFLDKYTAEDHEFVPAIADLTTVEGQENLRLEHTVVYEAYIEYLNSLAQRKPKVYQTATAYNGEILKKFGKDTKVEEKNKNGGLRLQSFSDFEIIHLIDNMQVIMDMSRVGLAGQAYTKVPDFAWAMGNTGLKINLSLIAKDVDADGHLVFDDVEGMPHDEAKKLRDAYSDNVGTIIVVFNDAQLKAAMADDFIDYIIPFHRSQLNQKQYDGLGLPKGAKDYTMVQNESYIEPVLNKNGKKTRPENYMPNKYWDFNKPGKENAEAYLKMCAENNRRPKFSNVLEYNGDGSYSLPADGSADGYWKLLIDFKMYNNDGVGVPQQPVKPDFNIDEANRMLSEYKGGHSNFPVAQDIVDAFVADYMKNHPDVRYSVGYWKPNLDSAEWDIVKSVMNNGRGANLTAIDKMFFEKTKGKTLFGIYSTDDDTLLYASRDEDAAREHQFVTLAVEEYDNGGLTDTSAEGLSAWAETVRVQSNANSDHAGDAVASGRLGGDADVYGEQPRLYASEALRNVLENIFKTEESRRANSVTEQPTQASEKSGASSLPETKYSLVDSTYAPTFYSKMERVVDAVKQEKLGAASVVPMLKGKGVKDEEIKWSGIEEWLDGKKSVTKQELLEFVRGSQLEIQEIVLDGTGERAKLPDNYRLEETTGDMGDPMMNLYIDGELVDVFEFDADDSIQSVGSSGIWAMNEDDLVGQILSHYESMSYDDAYGIPREPKWGGYKLDGGQNYREILFTVPGSSYTNNAMQAHWDNRTGVLAHARVQDFDTPNGKMLFVEEIQSDWHNEGQKRGYASSTVPELYERRDELYKRRDELWNADVDLAESDMTDAEYEKAIEPIKKELQDVMRQIREISSEIIAEEGLNTRRVPDAPFRKNYHEFVLKNLIRKAAEGGYGSIGWTTGKMQEERWSSDYAEGYRIEYDQDIPKFLNKYGKQWGAKVRKTVIGNRDYAVEIDSSVDMDDDSWLLGEGIHIDGDEVWSMPITDEMKQSVLYEGQARYSITPQFEQWYKETYGEDVSAAHLKRRLQTAERRAAEAEHDKKAAELKNTIDSEMDLTAWMIHHTKKMREQKRASDAKLAEARKAKTEAVRAAVAETKEIERAKAEVQRDADRMAERRNAAKRLRTQENAYTNKVTEMKENAKLKRNAAKATLRDSRLAAKKRAEIETEQGLVDTIRKNPKQRTGVEKLQDAAQQLRTLGRSAYRNFVNMAESIDRFSKRQVSDMRAGTLVNILGGSASTMEAVFKKGLVDRAGNRIGESMSDVFLCWDEAHKKVNEGQQALLQDFMLHWHNIDRMSIVARAESALETFELNNEWLRDMDQKEFARLVAMTEKEVEKLGKYEAQQRAFEYVRLIRAYNEAQNKPIFADDKGNSVTAETSQRIVDQYLAEQPWLLDKANGIYEWWDLFMRNWAVGDTISEAEYNRMRQMYPHYVPTYRADKNGVGGAGFVGAGGATVSKAVKKAKGSHSEVMNIEDSFSNIVSKIIRLNRLNELYMNIIDTAMLDEDGTFADMAYFDWDWQDGAYANALITGSADIADLTDSVEETEKAGLEKVGSDYKLTGWLNGRKYTAYISEDLYKSIGMVTGHLANDLEQNLLKAGNTLTTPMKTAITGINPTFAIRNLSRDLPTAIINSISGLNFPKYYAQAAKEIAKNSDHWKTFQALGGTHATYYNDNQGFTKAMSRGQNPAAWAVGKMGAFNEITEAQTRFAEYLATVDKLGDTYEARLQGIKNAAEVTVDFSRKGRYGKVINAWVPYWNPAVQGIDKTVRSVIDSPDGSAVWKQASKTLGRAAMTTVLFEAILYGVLKALDRDDEWEELNDRTKDTYYCIPLKDSNRFLKIPKNREWGAILGTPFMRMLEWANGREDPFENYIETAIEPNFLPPAIFRPDSGGGFASDIVGVSQALDLAKNEDFAGRTIVPYAYQQGTLSQQFDNETSALAKKLGELFDWSPMQIDYIIGDYFGDFGDMFINATSEATWSGEQNISETALEIVTNPFFADARYSNASVSKYYDLMDELGRVVQDKKNQMGNDAAKETIEYQTEKAIDEMYGKQISELNRIVRELPDGTEKDNAKSQIAQLTKEAIEFYNDSMSGKVSNPILTATYNGYSESVAKELTRMDNYSEQYGFKPRTTAPTSYVDPKNKKNEYRLDDEQKEYFMNVYAEKYDEIFEQLIQSSKYRKADNEKKAEMLEDAKADVNDAAKEELFDWLEDNRVRSTPKK